MSKKNHTNNGKKIKRVRFLLDDPFNVDFVDIDDKYLSALHKRLTSSLAFRKSFYSLASKDQKDLTPRVVIHKQDQKSQTPTTLKEQTVKHMVYRVDIPQEELFEIEKVFDDIPEFFEVKVTKSLQTEPKEKPQFLIIEEEETKTEDEKEEKETEVIENLPKWESVSDKEVEQDITIKQPAEPPIEEPFKEEKKEITPATVESTVVKDAFIQVKETEKSTKKPMKKTLSMTHDSFDEIDVWDAVEKEKPQVSLKEKARIFKIFTPIKQINQEIALVLYQHGITSIDELYAMSPKQLKGIEEIPSSLIKHVKKEQKKSVIPPLEFTSVASDPKDEEQKPTIPLKKQKSTDDLQFNHYNLYKKDITISEDKKRTVHFFSKEVPEDGDPASLPEGYEAKVNRKTGIPFIKKIRE